MVLRRVIFSMGIMRWGKVAGLSKVKNDVIWLANIKRKYYWDGLNFLL